MAENEIFDKEVDLFDQSIRHDFEYKPLVDLIHGIIAPYSIHQQLAENHIGSGHR